MCLLTILIFSGKDLSGMLEPTILCYEEIPDFSEYLRVKYGTQLHTSGAESCWGQLVNKFPTFYETQRSITYFARDHYPVLNGTSWINSKQSHGISVRLSSVQLSILYWRIASNFGARGGVVVKALFYKPAGRGFNSRCYHWNFAVT